MKNLPEEIAEFSQHIRANRKEAPKKTTTTTSNKTREGTRNRLPFGMFGYVPRGCSNPVNLRAAKRGYA